MMLVLVSVLATAGTSADFELVRPSVGDGPMGVYAPTAQEPGDVRWSVASWYTRNPLVLSEHGVEVGPVVRDRVVAWSGARVSASRRVALELSIMGIGQTGGAFGDLSSDGLGLGDPTVGVDVIVVGDAEHTAGGVRIDLTLPLGTTDRWMGDAGTRVMPTLYTQLSTGPLAWNWNIGVVTRGLVAGPENFALGNELIGRGALVIPLWPGAQAMTTVHARADVNRLANGNARFALEATAGLQSRIGERQTLQVMAGRGITGGYGTTDLRLAAQLCLELPQDPQPSAPPEIEVATRPDDGLYDAIIGDDEPTPKAEPELSPDDPVNIVVNGGRTSLEAKLHFVFGSAAIDEATFRELARVAEVLERHREIGHVVLEGHASWEGTVGYNYGLAEDRARAVFEALVSLGVHPERLSWRSMGEVQPTSRPEWFDRRVELLVTRWTEGQLSPDIVQPWDGQPNEEKR